MTPDESGSRSTAYGFVGAGAITKAIVEGLHANTADPPTVFLSPRNRNVAHELSSRFPNVQVCDSNQAVLECAGSIVVAVRPQLGRAVLEELTFRSHHVVISVLAGVPLEELREWTAPAGQLVRVIPLPSAARGQSLTAIFPDDAVARDLFGRVGEVVVPSGEATLDAFSAATSTVAAHLDHLATIATWLADHGVDHAAATAYIKQLFGTLGEPLLHQTDSLEALTENHMTPGGINEQFMTDLRRNGVPDVVRRGLDGVLARLRG
jgi:pyrroline-5-carboxylate reductase